MQQKTCSSASFDESTVIAARICFNTHSDLCKPNAVAGWISMRSHFQKPSVAQFWIDNVTADYWNVVVKLSFYDMDFGDSISFSSQQKKQAARGAGGKDFCRK